MCEFVVNSVHQGFAFKASHVSEVVGLARTIAKEFCVPVNSQLAGFASLSSDTHCERDLHVWLRGAYDINMEVTHVPIDVYDKHWKEVRVQHPILLPCDLARELWAAGDSVFESSMVGKAGAGGLNKFWQQVSKLGWGSKHPHLQNPDLFASQIPVLLHGDGARAFKVQKLIILSWSSALVRGCTWNSRCLFSVIPAENMIKGKTLQQILQHFADGINKLQSGIGSDGNPISGPWQSICLCWLQGGLGMAPASL